MRAMLFMIWVQLLSITFIMQGKPEFDNDWRVVVVFLGMLVWDLAEFIIKASK